MKVSPPVKRIVIALGVVALVIAATGLVLPAYRAWDETRVLSALAADPRTKQAAEDVRFADTRIAANPNDSAGYAAGGLAWKTIAEVTGSRKYLERSLAYYENGVVALGDKNSVMLLNAANVNAELGNLKRAEELYQATVKLDPGFQDGYLQYIDFLRLKKHAGKDEILKAYSQALKNLIDNNVVFENYAYYLFEVGEYKEAAPLFKTLDERAPGGRYRSYYEESLRRSS